VASLGYLSETLEIIVKKISNNLQKIIRDSLLPGVVYYNATVKSKLLRKLAKQYIVKSII